MLRKFFERTTLGTALSKYAQFPGKLHMTAANHVLRNLRGTFNKGILLTCGLQQAHCSQTYSGVGWTQIGQVIPIPADLIPVSSSCLMEAPAGILDARTPSLFLLPKPNTWANPTVMVIQHLGKKSTQTHRDKSDVLRHIIKNVSKRLGRE